MVDFKAIQDKWQKRWEDSRIFKVYEDRSKKKFYCLEMFPYPSAAFLHMGHVRNYSIGDTIARFKRMNGFNVLYPMGYDSFGLPAENASKKAKIHPREYTENAIANIVEYQKKLGLSYDWDRLIATHRPEYYKWNQYFFIKFFEKGLVYRKKANVNYCPNCKTVLANEEVEDGKCWRCHSEVVDKELDQWFFKTTAYTEELLNDIQKLDWSEKIKAIQENWIGKSNGVMINFHLDNKDKTLFPIFTTRPDTIYGVTFMVIALNHPKLKQLIEGTPYEETVKKFIEDSKKAEASEDKDFLEKAGVFTGAYAINPLNNERVPIYAGNFVVADYATGMIMAVPAHDQRDYEFAKKYNIPIKEVIRPIFGQSHDGEVLRKKIVAVVHRRSDDKFLFVKWKKFGWISPVIGGMDDETAEKAAEREVYEETGYKCKAVRRLGGIIETHFFAENKNEWRYGEEQPMLLELESETPEHVHKDEESKHQAIWLTADDAKKLNTHPYNNIGLLRYLGEDQAYISNGKLVHSESFNGLGNKEAIEKISDYIEKHNLGKRTVQYKLKDWLISRQRYWGTPIPMIFCDRCGIIPLPEKELPLLLPDDVDFSTPGNPLLTSKTFVNVKCPNCSGPAKRETDTMGGFMDSSWYFLRFCSPQTTDVPFDTDAVRYWMPVDQYVGGIEHAVGHLIYSRFFTKVLRDFGMLDIDEPFNALFNQGIVYKDGHKMSKSFGNIVTQDEIASKYGIDTARLFMLSVAAPDKEMEWNDKGIEGTFKIINRTYKLFEDFKNTNSFSNKKDKYLISKKNVLMKQITGAINDFRLNNAIIYLMEFVDYINDNKDNVSRELLSEALRDLSLLLNPFVPHLSEECYEMIGEKEFSSMAAWPEYNDELIDEELHFIEDVVKNTKRDIYSVISLSKIEKPSGIRLIIADKWKYDMYSRVCLLSKNNASRDISLISKELMTTDLKKHGQEIMKILPRIVDKLPSCVLWQDLEYDAFIEEKNDLEKEFGCAVEVIKESESTEQKAKNAMPGKPAIIVR